MISPRLAFRTLARTPFVTTVTVLSLALGIGPNVAIFSFFEHLLLSPLPVRDPGSLVNLAAPGPKPGSQSCGLSGSCEVVFSYPMFRDLEQRSGDIFTGIAAHRSFGANIAYRGNTESAEATLVSGSYFPLLGLQPSLGRLFTPADDQVVGGHFVAVLSHSYWETRLGSDPGVLNQTIIVNGHPLTIIGVAPAGFEGTTLGARPRVYVPITMRGQMEAGFDGFENRRSYWVYLFARLRPGVTREQAAARINAIYQPILSDIEAPLQQGMSDQTMARFLAKKIELSDGRRGQSSVHTDASTPLLLLMATTGIVLLIACANVANLLLARGANRSMEMAVRLSLGAGRRHVMSQLLTEACLLALMGGAAGLLVAKWTIGFMASIMPSEVSMLVPELNVWMIVFAAGLSIGTGFLFGLFPALHSTRPDLVATLRANSGQPSGARAAARFRGVLVTSQIALSMMLLTIAGLFVKSLMNVSRVDLGLQIENVLTFGIAPQLNGYTPQRSQLLFARLEEELAAVPGVTAVTAAMVPVLAGSSWGSDVRVQGFECGPDTDCNARYNEVGPGFFRAMGITLLAGREFTAADNIDGPKVAIVNEEFVRKFNLGNDAVGKRIASGRRSSDELDTEIIGVVRNAAYADVKDEIPALFYRPYRQDSTLGFLSFYVRSVNDPRQLMRTVPSVVAALDPNLPVEELKTMPQQVRENIFLDRMVSLLSSAFATLATILAAVGLYGVLAYTVAQRTREIGVRMALGADARRVRYMVLRQVGIMTLIGGAVGIAAAIGLGGLARSLLYGIEGHDPVVMLSSITILVLVALGAGAIPAARASRVDPMQALRYE
ncbi:MAG TPA: ABC transporter permease [Gemmatimonadaceae bacterium]